MQLVVVVPVTVSPKKEAEKVMCSRCDYKTIASLIKRHEQLHSKEKVMKGSLVCPTCPFASDKLAAFQVGSVQWVIKILVIQFSNYTDSFQLHDIVSLQSSHNTVCRAKI